MSIQTDDFGDFDAADVRPQRVLSAGAASAEPNGWYGAIDAGYHMIDDINAESSTTGANWNYEVNDGWAAFARLGIRDINPALRKTADRLDGLLTPEGGAIPPLARAELRRDMARLRFVEDQI